MATIRTPALILRHTPDREHDRMLTVLTPEHGQLRLRARGTKKSVSKLGGSLEPLTEVELMIADGRVVDQIIGSVIRRRFSELRQDALSLVMAQWFLELVERVTKPGQVGSGLYAKVLEALGAMSTETDWTPGRRWLSLYRRAWETLEHEGFAPSLKQCAVCHRPLVVDDIHYHPNQGFVHGGEAETGGWAISTELHGYILEDRTPADERQVWQELRKVLDQVMFHTLDRPLQSEPVLRTMMRAHALPVT